MIIFLVSCLFMLKNLIALNNKNLIIRKLNMNILPQGALKVIEEQKLLQDLNIKKLPYSLSNENISDIRSNLMSWYKTNRRKMPWRGDQTNIPISGYSVWVSEVMLQQTRVETVIDYWNKWMERFPDIKSLAEASSEEVNRLWAGLGYYRRAQNLLNGAKYVVENFNGVLPNNKEELLKIPGIGPYTAGAISSIAFNLSEPLVDGNVLRVFSRLFTLYHPLGGGTLEKISWEIASQIVDISEPGIFNQGLMELGATICKPTNPNCSICPLQNICKAKQVSEILTKTDLPEIKDIEDIESWPSTVSYFPLKKEKKKPREITLNVCVIRRKYVDNNGNDVVYRYLFVKRPEKGLLANQWEFPSIQTQSTSIDNSSSSWSKYFIESKNILLIGLDHMLPESSLNYNEILHSQTRYQLSEPIIHIFSHERHTMHILIEEVELVSLPDSDPQRNSNIDICWKSAKEIIETGITTGCKKILQQVENYFSQPFKDANQPKKRIKLNLEHTKITIPININSEVQTIDLVSEDSSVNEVNNSEITPNHYDQELLPLHQFSFQEEGGEIIESFVKSTKAKNKNSNIFEKMINNMNENNNKSEISRIKKTPKNNKRK